MPPSCTKPGGYVELAEVSGALGSDDDSVPPAHPLKLTWDHLMCAMRLTGHDMVEPHTLAERLTKAGFIGVKSFRIKQPFGGWPHDARLKAIGEMSLLNIHLDLEAYCLAAFTRVLGMSKDDATALLREAAARASDKGMHAYNYL